MQLKLNQVIVVFTLFSCFGYWCFDWYVAACIDHRGTPEHPARTCTLEYAEGDVCVSALSIWLLCMLCYCQYFCNVNILQLTVWFYNIAIPILPKTSISFSGVQLFVYEVVRRKKGLQWRSVLYIVANILTGWNSSD